MRVKREAGKQHEMAQTGNRPTSAVVAKPEEPEAALADTFIIDLRDVSAIDLLPVGVLLADEIGTVSWVNQTWRDLSGLTPADSTDRGWLRVLDPGDRALVLDHVRAAAEVRATSAADFQITAGGRRHWTRWWIRASDRPTARGQHLPVAIAVADSQNEHAIQEELRHRAIHDPLTGLVVRRHLFEVIDLALRSHERHPSDLAVLYVDLDGFKTVNDSHGHATGDQVLTTVAGKLQRAVRPEDVVARVGGDEFAVMCDHLADEHDADVIVDRIQAALDAPLHVGDKTFEISASVGIAFANSAHDTPEMLLDRADHAMYRSKRALTHGAHAHEQ